MMVQLKKDFLRIRIFSMYPYHNKIKQRIRNREFTHYEYVQDYKGISPCLLLYFNTEPKIRPIRKHRFKEYEKFIGLNY